MKKNGFTIIELCVVFCVILGVCFLFIPKGIESTKKVKLISKWEQKYSEIQYVFKSIKLQTEEKGQISSEEFKEILKNDFRVIKLFDKVYEPRLKHKKVIIEDSIYNIEKYYITYSDEILGFKWINKNCKDEELCAIMTFDLNGIEEPNIFGEDIYGINIFRSRISPFGEDTDANMLRQNCKNIGMDCSYYYLIGGHFE